MEKETLKLSKLHFRAQFDADSVDEDKRTVDVIWTTGARGKRFDWMREEYFYEELGLEPDNIRLDFLNSGRAAVLDNHGRWNDGIEGAVGRVVAGSVRKEGDSWRATLEYDTDERSEKVYGKVKRGFAPNISVGYKIHKMQRMDDIEEGGKNYRLMRATDWEPMEISNVIMPFDRGAHTRNEGEELFEVAVITRSAEETPPEHSAEAQQETKQERNMADNNKPNPQDEKEKNTPTAVDADQVRAEATAAERKRTADILEAVRKAGLEESFGLELVNNGVSVDEARASIIDKYAEKDPHTAQRGVTVKVTADETDNVRRTLSDALILRANPGFKIAEGETERNDREKAAHQYRGMRLVDLARESLDRDGVNTRGMAPDEIAKRAITSSTADFPIILENTINRVLLANYQNAPDTWRRFCATGSVSDFREHERLRLGSLSRLEKVLENGEFRDKSISDAEKEVIRAFEYGNIINLSRTAIVNDSLDAFGRLPMMLARAAARSIEVDVYALFGLNGGDGPTMVDGNPLFHASHNNINGTASALTVEGIDADRVIMAKQKEKDGNDFLDLRPSVLVVPIELGGTAKVINDAQFDPDASGKYAKPNKVRGLFNDVVDTPRLSGTVRYLFANPAIEPVFEVAFLNGVQTPYMEMQESFRQSGLQWKIRLDYGVGAVGYRGVVRNAGTSGGG